LSAELERRNTNLDLYNPLRSTQSVLDSIDTGGVNISNKTSQSASNTNNSDLTPLLNLSSSIYDEYSTNIMQWAYSASQKQEIVKYFLFGVVFHVFTFILLLHYVGRYLFVTYFICFL